ncbi:MULTISPECIES: restriction endonuclease subunit S [unclassified Prochlorococcus]|uniref:restriction endonuclease subunit S n=1 Tax=unclassified Prochlorococcus TaxID=2627481 RepID=UPI00053388CD|nr:MULTISPECIES: restriction endonuclease subunit S [unclassified Prochlorococcus]KGG16171.1 Type I restriction-modification system [Prochlorococcus sp. MIT 0602]KGG17291.1 Type I restriction-modification system [Prochlorococcus sp. MIT 0603]
MKYKGYSSYNNRNIPWAEKIPSHWQIKQLTRFCKGIGSGTTPIKDIKDGLIEGSIPWVLTGDLNDDELKECQHLITDNTLNKYSALKVYPSNSIVVAMYGATIGKVSLLKFPATVNQACCVLPPSNQYESKFIFYTFIAMREFLLSLAMGGAQSNINITTIKSLSFPFPSKPEQHLIYKFLDEKINPINLLIDKHLKLITLLEEKRNVLILNSITKGLEPNKSMKYSGLRLLGDIPKHWKLKSLSLLLRTKKGSRSNKLTKEFCSKNKGPYPVYSGQTENNGIMASINQYEFEVNKEGVILSTTVGEKAMSVRRIQGRFSLSQNCMIISSKDNSCLMSYLEYCLKGIFQLEKDRIPKYIKPSFRKEDFQQIKIPVPPIKEQKDIVTFLNKKILPIDELIKLSKLLILKLEDKKSSLIFLATTGQITPFHNTKT